MKSLVEFIKESSQSSKYDTTVYDFSSEKAKKLVPSEDENKNYIIARLGGHFSWGLKSRTMNVDDYIEKDQYGDYVMNIQSPDVDRWEAEGTKSVVKIGTATLLKTSKGTARMKFTFNNDKVYVSCRYGTNKSKSLGSYDVVDNPTDKECPRKK